MAGSWYSRESKLDLEVVRFFLMTGDGIINIGVVGGREIQSESKSY